MTKQQLLQQLRQELQINERTAKLIREYAAEYANELYRKTSTLDDHAMLLRLTGTAHGIEKFIDHITQPK